MLLVRVRAGWLLARNDSFDGERRGSGISRPVEQVDKIDGCCAMAFSPDGSRLWLDRCAYEVVRPNSVEAAFCVHGQGGDIFDVSWSSDGSRVATASTDGSVLWDARTGTQELTIAAGRLVLDIELSPVGKRLALGLGDGTVSLWDLTQTGATKAFDVPAFESGVQSMKFSPDGTRLVAGTGEGVSKVLDVTPEGGGEGFTTASTGAVALAATADLLAVGKEDGAVEIIDADTGHVVRKLRGRDTKPVVDVTFDGAGARSPLFEWTGA